MSTVDFIARWCVILGGLAACIGGSSALIVWAVSRVCSDAHFVDEFFRFCVQRRIAENAKKTSLLQKASKDPTP
jgi:hypothetical protein